MIFYIIIFTILSLWAMFDAYSVKREQRLVALFGSWLLLALFAGLRYNSPDYIPYWEGFEEVAQFGLDYAKLDGATFFEPGYNLLVWVITWFAATPVVMFVIVAALAVGINLSCYKRYTNFFLLATLLYFVHTFLLRETMQIRAGVAAAIILYSLRFVASRQFWCFVLMMVAAMSFHLASTVFFLVYVVYRWNWSPRVWGWIVVSCIAVAYVAPFGKLLAAIPLAGIGARIAVYQWMIGEKTMGILTNPTIVKQLFFVFIGLRYWNILSEKVVNYKLFFLPLVMSVCWLLVWNDFAIIAGRMGTYLSVTEVVIVPSFLYLVTPRSRPIMTLLIILYAFFTLYLNYQSKNILDYTSIFSL